jgi:hypothetical protein
MSKSLIVYRGPSQYDGKPIVAILQPGSGNSKTGNMAQLWILADGIAPIAASRTGEDFRICGNCPHRGIANPGKPSGWSDNRACYVNLIQAPTAIYNALQRGNIAQAATIGQVKEMLSGIGLRLGAYGDPGALPIALLDMLCNMAAWITGYTHSHTVGITPHNRCMVSVDSAEESRFWTGKGYRTFRVVPIRDSTEGNTDSTINSIECPSYKGIQCRDCRLCDGAKQAKSVHILAHGGGKKHVGVTV